MCVEIELAELLLLRVAAFFGRDAERGTHILRHRAQQRAVVRCRAEPEFSEHVLRTLGAEAATTLLVGDSPFDVETGRNAGFPCWCVTTGTHDAAQLAAAGADKIFADLATLGAEL